MDRVVVLGGGISGYGSAVLAKKEGFDVFLSDRGALSSDVREMLERWDIAYEQGEHTLEKILSADLVIKSPGIPDSVPIVRQILDAGIPVVSEIEFAGRYMGSAKSICITGSNGKTTTTSLIYKILCDAGYSVCVGGNIGESFAYSVATASYDWYVLELSSFQLDGMFDFRADIAVLLNITPDHLDRYDYSFEKYARSKMRIAQNQRAEDYFIYFAADKTIEPLAQSLAITMQKITFGAQPRPRVETLVRGVEISIDASRLKLRGEHNLYNAEAAAAAAAAAGVSAEVIERSICEFEAVEHRMQPIKEIGGVLYINDSKATNVDSAWYALQAMNRPVVWIAGGTDKGNDYSPLKEFAAQKVHTLISMGVDNSPLEREFADVVESLVIAKNFEDAMRAAHSAARPGDVVLLSPACASFDLFKSYIHRGECFTSWVNELNKKEQNGEG